MVGGMRLLSEVPTSFFEERGSPPPLISGLPEMSRYLCPSREHPTWVWGRVGRGVMQRTALPGRRAPAKQGVFPHG
jgi:hypothetical protein